ncbi:hypothetical protein F4810DRAFT_723121 [Camillea tinctor]|nr:hypothetical protein F4810DRAFT_723121 [Camillea tinctor]
MPSKASEIINGAILDSISYLEAVEEERIRRAGKEKMARTTRDLAATAQAEYETRLRAALDEIKTETEDSILEAHRASQRERLEAENLAAEPTDKDEEEGSKSWLDLGSGILKEYLDVMTPRGDRDEGAKPKLALPSSRSFSPKARLTSSPDNDDEIPLAKLTPPRAPPSRGSKRRRSIIIEDTPSPPFAPTNNLNSDPLSSSAPTISTGDFNEEIPARRPESQSTANTPTPGSRHAKIDSYYRRLLYGGEGKPGGPQSSTTSENPDPDTSATTASTNTTTTTTRSNSRRSSGRSTANAPSSYDVKEYYRNFKF